MTRSTFYVDFNEMIDERLVGLSSGDEKVSVSGVRISLRDGLAIDVYSDDIGDDGEPDNLVASGVVERNAATGWASNIKWCCRIDARGIRHASDVNPKDVSRR
jgi:hypothetical protein